MPSLTGGPILVLAVVITVLIVAALVLVTAVLPRPARRRRRALWAGGVAALVLLAQGLAVFAAGLVVNDQYDFYASWSDLAGQGSTATPVIQVGGLVTGGQGRLVLDTVHRHRIGSDDQVVTWLPPQYDQPAYQHTRFPVVMFLPGQPSSPEVVFHQFDFANVASRAIAAGVPPFVAVFPTLMIDPPHDTECTNIPGGPAAETWLSKDVPAYVRSHFRVAPTGRAWSVMGWSTGGFCAAKVMLAHQREFSSAASFGGYYQPIQDHTTGNLFHGNKFLRQRNSPLWLLRNLRLLHDRLLVVASRQDREAWPPTEKFLYYAHTESHVASLLPKSGGHNFRVYSVLLPTVLRWTSRGWPRTSPAVSSG